MNLLFLRRAATAALILLPLPSVHAQEAGVVGTIPVHAAAPAPAAPVFPSTADGWVTFGGGFYEGRNYHDHKREDDDDDSGSVGGPAVMLAFRYTPGNRFYASVRGNWLVHFTRNKAEDYGLIVGFRPDAEGKIFLGSGISRLTDVSNHTQNPRVGVPLEALWYPRRGFEVGAFGNLNNHRSYGGLTLGVAIGRERAPN